jgi:hypothetical protein
MAGFEVTIEVTELDRESAALASTGSSGTAKP